MEKRRLMKRASVFAILCALAIAMIAEPAFAAEGYKVNDGGSITDYTSTPRGIACKKMEEMSQMEWTLPETLYYCTKQSGGRLTADSKIKLYKYKDGKSANGLITRKGIPYTQVDREYSFPSGTFTLIFGEKTLSADGQIYRSVYGNDCSSSVSFAWRKGTGNNSAASNFLKKNDKNNTIYNTKNMFNDAMNIVNDDIGTGNYIKTIGDYGDYNKAGATTTKAIVTALSADGYYGAEKDIYSEVYAKIKPGDALLFRDASGGHVRLVIGVHIEYKDAAKTQVDPEKSHVDCIEQIGFRKYDPNATTDEKKIASNWSSSWIPNDEVVQEGKYKGKKFNGQYSFSQLAGKVLSPAVNGSGTTRCYIPIRLNVWS